MANSHTPSLRRRSQRRASTPGLPWSERQLDAYLQARDALRRVSAVAAFVAGTSRETSPPSTAA